MRGIYMKNLLSTKSIERRGPPKISATPHGGSEISKSDHMPPEKTDPDPRNERDHENSNGKVKAQIKKVFWDLMLKLAIIASKYVVLACLLLIDFVIGWVTIRLDFDAELGLKLLLIAISIMSLLSTLVEAVEVFAEYPIKRWIYRLIRRTWK
jgi:hypothetical protein